MTNQASELFELCKEVYGRFPEWDEVRQLINEIGSEMDKNDWLSFDKSFTEIGYYPLYTSDYLLEKLPEWTRVQKIGNDTGKYSASYELDYITSLGDTALVGSSDTPLKSLLKLTIALSEAGELK